MEQKQQQRQANRTMNQENRREKRRQLQSYVRKRHQSGCKKPVQTILTKSHWPVQTKKSKTIKRKKERIEQAKGKQKKTRCLEANLLSMHQPFLTSAKHTRHLFRKWKTTSAVLANGSIAPIPTEKKSKKNRREMAKKKLSATKTKIDIKTKKRSFEKWMKAEILWIRNQNTWKNAAECVTSTLTSLTYRLP